MKYQDIIESLRTNPSDDNLSVAREWIGKRKRSTKSVELLAAAILGVRHDREMLEWLGSWLVDKQWDIACSTIISIQTIEVHDWLIEFARKNPTNREVGKLWAELLSYYRDKSLTSAASEWLVNYGCGVHAERVAAHLLALTDSDKVRAKAKQLADDNPNSDELIEALLKYVGDSRCVDLGVRLADTVEPHVGSIICGGLLKAGAINEVQQWFRMNWEHKDAHCFFGSVMPAAPLAIAPLAFEWLDDHPQAPEANRIFRTAYVLSPSQELIDITWNWLKDNLRYSYAPAMLTLLFADWAKLKTPLDAVLYTDKWLRENLMHDCAFKLVLKVLIYGVTNERLDLARRWLSMRDPIKRGTMLMSLLRCTDELDFVKQAEVWIEQHPDTVEAQSIVVELLKKNPTRFLTAAKTVLPRIYMPAGQLMMLCELIRVCDPDSVKIAKRWIREPYLELRYAESQKCMKARLLIPLLESVPSDEEVLKLAREWIEDKGDVCEEHLTEFQRVYEKALAAGSEKKS